MVAEALALLLRFNLVAGAAIALVFLLRPWVRRWFGAHHAYALWLAPPFAMAGALLPPARASGPAGLLEAAGGRADLWLSSGRHTALLLAIWGLGLAISVGVLAWRYVRFLAAVRAGRAGPAIVGVFAPRMVTPADFADRFTPEEQQLVRAHERAHMDRLDARCNALLLALQCLNWFNPLIQAAARAVRFDQELACDATVMTRLPAARRRYAETLLRSQQPAIASPLACGWQGGGTHPLVMRLAMLAQRPPGDQRHSLGSQLVAALCALALAAAWTVQPPYRFPQQPLIVLPNLQIIALLVELSPPHPGGH